MWHLALKMRNFQTQLWVFGRIFAVADDDKLIVPGASKTVAGEKMRLLRSTNGASSLPPGASRRVQLSPLRAGPGKVHRVSAVNWNGCGLNSGSFEW